MDLFLQKVNFILGLQPKGWDLSFRFSGVDVIMMRTEAVFGRKGRAGVGWQSPLLVNTGIGKHMNVASIAIPTLIFLYFSPPDCKDTLA